MYSKEKKGTVGHYDGDLISPKYQEKLNQYQKSLSRKLTPAETIFEERIAKLIAEEARTPYRTQRIFYITDEIAFITDFYFKSFKVAVEVDGREHYFRRNKERDVWRDGLLLAHAGVSVIRFSNKAVLTKTSEVFDATVRFLGQQENGTPSHRKYLRKVYSDLFD
jgi:very-short-patch-repair endonuclease